MGDNRGYSIYEVLITDLYDSGILDKTFLSIALTPFKNTDMDHGGCNELRSKDNLSADEIVVKIGNPIFWNDYLLRKPTDEYDEDLMDEFHDEWRKLTETF